jgi:hypothetical protein
MTNETTKRAVIETAIDMERGTVLFSCINGHSVTVAVDNLAANIQRHAMLHGIKQKLIDAAAISRNPETGRSATPDDKWNALREVFDRITAPDGTWNKIREGSGGSGGLLFAALCRLYPAKTPETLREFLAGKSPAEQAALRANPKVSAIIDQIRAERGAAVDSDELLGELDA